MAFVVVLDTCVLFPAHLRDTLLRLAEIELFVPVWSAHIMGELERNFIEYRVAPTAVARLTALMSDTFPDASVIAYEDLIPSMTCHEKDRHVLAAAVRSGAAALVTFNLRDFPAKSTEPYGIDVVDPGRLPPRPARSCSACGSRRTGPTGGSQSTGTLEHSPHCSTRFRSPVFRDLLARSDVADSHCEPSVGRRRKRRRCGSNDRGKTLFYPTPLQRSAEELAR